ncbi:MAG: hypothetical protein R2735_11405 [Microthrixaceae bacterium]
MVRKVSLISAAVAVTLVLAPACSKVAEKAGEKASEKLVESESGGNADVDIKDDGVDIKTDDGTFSSTNKIPKEWPEDIPVPDDFTVAGGSTTSQGDSMMVIVVGTSKTSFDDLKAYFKGSLSDWDEVSATEVNIGEPLFSGMYKKGDRSIQIGISDKGSSRDLSLNYASGPAQ